MLQGSRAFAAQLAQGITRHPAGTTRSRVLGVSRRLRICIRNDRLRRADRRRVEGCVPLADVAQRPVDGLLDEVAPVARLAPHERQDLEKRPIAGLLVLHRQRRSRGEGGAFDPRILRSAPLLHLVVCVGRLVEEVGRHLVAQIPRVERRRPVVHLRRRHQLGVVHHAGQNPRFVSAGLPERQREAVVAPPGFGHAPQLVHRHSERLLYVDAVPPHPVAIRLRAEAIKLVKHRRGAGDRRHRL